MPSLFPRRVDIIPTVAQSNNQVPSSTTSTFNRPSAKTLSRLSDSLLQIERHLGFSFATASDIRVDETTVSAITPGRTLVVLETVLTVPLSANNTFAFLTDWGSLFNETQIANANPYPASIVPTGNITPTLLTEDPFIITATRVSNTYTPNQTLCKSSLVSSILGKLI